VFSDTGNGAWCLHAQGTVLAGAASVDLGRRSLPAIVARLGEPRSPADHAAAMSARGLQYGPGFRTIEELRVGDGEGLGRLRLRTDAPSRPPARPSGLDG